MFQPILRSATRRPVRLARFQFPASRPLSSTRQLRLKEDKAQSAEQIEKAKQEQLKSGNKKEELESQSESAVAADQDDKNIDQMQKETAKEHQEEHPEGKS